MNSPAPSPESLQQEVESLSDADLVLVREVIKDRVSKSQLSSIAQATEEVAAEYLTAIETEINRRAGT